MQNMINMDIIEPLESPYASSIIVAKKFYFCNLNKVTILFYPEPMSDLDEIMTKISSIRFFSKLDLCKGIGKFLWKNKINS